TYERLLAIDPTNQEAYLYLAALLGKRGEPERAVATLRTLLARNPSSVLAHYYLGRIYAAAHQLDKAAHPSPARRKLGPRPDLVRAATEFNLVLAAAPKSWVVRYYLGAVYAERHETARALEEFGKIPPDSDYYVDARIRRAYLLQKDDLPEAVREIRAALGVK